VLSCLWEIALICATFGVYLITICTVAIYKMVRFGLPVHYT